MKATMLNYAAIITFVLFSAVTFGASEPKPITFEKSVTVKGETHEHAVGSMKRAQYLYPSNWGQVGTFRLRSAETTPSGTLTFGIGAEFYSINDAPDFGVGGRNAETLAENIFIGYTPTDQLTLAISRRNSSTTFGNPKQLISSLGDLNISALYSIPLNEMMAIAPFANFLIASNFNNLAPAGTTLSVGAGGAFTMNFYQVTNIPLWAHLNVVYHMPQIRETGPATVAPETYFSFSRYHTLELSLGAEVKLADFIPFVELSRTTHTNSVLGFGSAPTKLSIGTRITPFSNKSLCFLLGTDIALGRSLTAGVPFTPGYQILGQLSYSVGLTSTERKHYNTTSDVNIVDRKFVIKEDIKFKLNSAQLKAESTGLLDEIAQVIMENDINKLLIVGHTDSTHTEEYNLSLSKKRADSVKKALSKREVPSSKLITQGYGKRKPIASNLTEKGRAKNRRVEFYVLD